MNGDFLDSGVVVVCVDDYGVYTWVSESLETARKFIRENLEEIYGVKVKDMSDFFVGGDFVEFYDSTGEIVKYKVEDILVV